MKIEVLYFDGCPNYQLTLDRVQDVLKEEGISSEISELNIRDERLRRQTVSWDRRLSASTGLMLSRMHAH